jgi:glycosyltransferase involved in cell wall biosynthesis
MSCKTCVIISDSKYSATSQYALSCYSLFNHGDFLSLRDKIDYLIENRDVREELAELYLNLSKNYSLDVSINRFINEVLIKSIENRQHKM